AGELLGDRETEPASGRDPALDAVEALEDGALLSECDPARVARHAQLTAIAAAPSAHPDGRPARRVHERVSHERAAHLQYAFLVTETPHVLLELGLEHMTRRRRERLELRDERLGEIGEIGGLPDDAQLAGVDT